MKKIFIFLFIMFSLTSVTNAGFVTLYEDDFNNNILDTSFWVINNNNRGSVSNGLLTTTQAVTDENSTLRSKEIDINSNTLKLSFKIRARTTRNPTRYNSPSFQVRDPLNNKLIFGVSPKDYHRGGNRTGLYLYAGGMEQKQIISGDPTNDWFEGTIEYDLSNGHGTINVNLNGGSIVTYDFVGDTYNINKVQLYSSPAGWRTTHRLDLDYLKLEEFIDGPEAIYEFDNNGLDTSGNNNNLLVTDIDYVDDFNGNTLAAGKFNGNTSKAISNDNFITKDETSTFSLSTIITPNEFKNSIIANTYEDITNRFYFGISLTSDGKIKGTITKHGESEDTIFSNIDYKLGNTYDISLVYDGNSLYLYINGLLDGEIQRTFDNSIGGSLKLNIGNHPSYNDDNYKFNGIIHYIGFFGNTLDADTIYSNYYQSQFGELPSVNFCEGGDEYIVGERSLKNYSVCSNTNLIVTEGAKLIVDDGVTFKFDGVNNKIVIKDGGALIIKNSSKFITNNDGEDSTGGFEVTIKDTGGVKFFSNGTFAKSCNEYKNPINDSYYYKGDIGDGIYRIDPGTGAFDVYCDMTSDDGGWTLAYKISGQSTMKTTGNYNIDNLSINDFSGDGKLDDNLIKTLYSNQYRVEGKGFSNLYCKFENIDNYGDNIINDKYCSESYLSSGNYTTLYTQDTWNFGFSTRGANGARILQLLERSGETRKGNHTVYGTTTSNNCDVKNSTRGNDRYGCYSKVWIK